jgi:hypothetical protein
MYTRDSSTIISNLYKHVASVFVSAYMAHVFIVENHTKQR